jgi:regulator of protease activity HflC (stomatin/prohibitin superfamily)
MYVVGVVAILVLIVLAKTAVVVPQQSAYVVETLGRYNRTIQAGFHILVPFIDRVAYRHNLKEEAMDIPEQVCITRDNVQVGVDGVLYLQVLDASKASYGITNYRFAIIQLAQTTLRSEIGKIELDRTFEERATINANVVSELDKASAPWGVKVLRYEIKNINPPKDVLSAMEKQMRAEREKRAVVLASEGERDAKINQAEGEKQRVIKESEANKQQQINEAQGQAAAILAGRDGDGRGFEAGGRGARGPRRHRGDAAQDCRGVRQAVRHPRERGLEHARRAGEPLRHLLDDRACDERREKPEGDLPDGTHDRRRQHRCIHGRFLELGRWPQRRRRSCCTAARSTPEILRNPRPKPCSSWAAASPTSARGGCAPAAAGRREGRGSRGQDDAARPHGLARAPRGHRRSRARLRPHRR